MKNVVADALPKRSLANKDSVFLVKPGYHPFSAIDVHQYELNPE